MRRRSDVESPPGQVKGARVCEENVCEEKLDSIQIQGGHCNDLSTCAGSSFLTKPLVESLWQVRWW